MARPRPIVFLGLLLLASVLFRAVWIAEPTGSLIFDEAYYVNAARVIDHIKPPARAPYVNDPLGVDPNHEHPPLGKLFIAGSIKAFGDNGVGWRVSSVVAGMFCILLLYLLVAAAGADRWLAVLAAALFSFDNLVMVHSRIGVLDIFLLMFMLLAAWGAMRGWPWLAGIGAGLATLVKINGTYAIAALLVFYGVFALLRWRRERRFPREEVVAAGIMLAVFLPLWIGGLFLLDRAVTPYKSPIEHIQFMIKYGFALKRPGGPANVESYPWQWLINEVQMPYLRVDQTVGTGPNDQQVRALINFRGAMNPVLIGTFPLAFAYSAWRAWKFQERLSIFVIAWLIGAYLPFYYLAIVGERISYIFYFLPTMPVVAISIAQLLRHEALPRLVMWVYLVAVLGAFVGYFPFRALV
ncbi:MAG: glycosyltransferase family 39 protein [Candidatus Dormibacteraeota bacterium]|nr:glycosyltransferase family 39 protein [Candidatus Dormibacteraeota bacterium]